MQALSLCIFFKIYRYASYNSLFYSFKNLSGVSIRSMLSSGTWIRHCRAAFMKQVLPRFLRPMCISIYYRGGYEGIGFCLGYSVLGLTSLKMFAFRRPWLVFVFLPWKWLNPLLLVDGVCRFVGTGRLTGFISAPFVLFWNLQSILCCKQSPLQ